MYLLHEDLMRARHHERRRELRAAALENAARRSLREPHEARPYAVTIRLAWPDDALALERLAALDSQTLPPPPLLVAEVGGELRAARSLRDGRSVASPFVASAALCDLLAARARQLAAAPPRRRLRELLALRTLWRARLDQGH